MAPLDKRRFLPLSRMRHIRWEEAVLRSILRRAGARGAITIRHIDCHCGSVECLGQPHDVNP